MSRPMVTVVGGTEHCEIVLTDLGFYVRCFTGNCGHVSERTYAKHVARQMAAAHDASHDQTAGILAEYGTPGKRRDYALAEAKRVYREAQAAAKADYEAAGGILRGAEDQRGEPLYDVLIGAVQDAAAEHERASRAATAAYRAETEAS